MCFLKTVMEYDILKQVRKMLYLSKSKYCRLWQCPKMLWLDT